MRAAAAAVAFIFTMFAYWATGYNFDRGAALGIWIGAATVMGIFAWAAPFWRNDK